LELFCERKFQTLFANKLFFLLGRLITKRMFFNMLLFSSEIKDILCR